MGLSATGENLQNCQKWTSLPVPENSDEERLERLAEMLRDDTARCALHHCLRKTTRNRSTGQRDLCHYFLSTLVGVVKSVFVQSAQNFFVIVRF